MTSPLRRWRAAMGAIAALALPVAAHAQPGLESPKLPRADVVALAGWAGADTSDLPEQVFGTWDGASLVALGLGFYWTEHVKTELDVGAFGTRELYGSVLLDPVGATTRYAYDLHRISTRSLSLTPIYQFLHNTWVHPFAGAGLDLDWDRRRTVRQLRSTTSVPGMPSIVTTGPVPDVIATRLLVRIAAAVGFKAYVSPRVFLRSDVRVGLGGGVQTVRWRAGGGLDF